MYRSETNYKTLQVFAVLVACLVTWQGALVEANSSPAQEELSDEATRGPASLCLTSGSLRTQTEVIRAAIKGANQQYSPWLNRTDSPSVQNAGYIFGSDSIQRSSWLAPHSNPIPSPLLNPPAQSSTQPPPLNEFVEKLLKFAKEEAAKPCRGDRDNRVCRRDGGSKGYCLQAVRMAIQRALGLPTNSGFGNSAKNAGPPLAKLGFRLAPRGQYNQATAPPGSVLIYDVPGNQEAHGHIEIRGRDGYYSDYRSEKPINTILGRNRRLIGVYLPPESPSLGGQLARAQ